MMYKNLSGWRQFILFFLVKIVGDGCLRHDFFLYSKFEDFLMIKFSDFLRENPIILERNILEINM